MEKTLISRNTSTILKGVLCVFVLLHHLLRTNSFFVDSILNELGPIGVGGFLLLSGYGLIVNYKQHGVSYLKKVLFKRIPLTYLLVILTNLVYLTIYIFTEPVTLSTLNIITSVFYISFSKNFIFLYSWIYFLVDLLIYYFCFVIIFMIIESFKKLKQKPKTGAIAYLIIVFIIYLTLSLVIQKPLGQRAIFCFTLGLTIGAFEDVLLDICIKKRFIFIIVLSLLNIILFNFTHFVLIKEQILPLAFSLLLVIMLSNINMKSAILTYVGKISLYIYLTHGYFLKLFNFLYDFSSFVNFILVSLCSIATASIIYFTISFVKNKKTKH